MTNDDELIQQAIRKYLAEQKRGGSVVVDQPSVTDSEVFVRGGRQFVTLRNNRGDLETYRVREDGALRRPTLEDTAALALTQPEDKQ